jgi:hypothetical protein
MIDQQRLAAEALKRLPSAPEGFAEALNDRQERVRARQARAEGPSFAGPQKMLREPCRRAPAWCYSKVSARALSDHRHTVTSKGLLGILARWGRRNRWCDAFVEQLADELSVTPRTIQRAQTRLEQLGYIRVERRRFGRINDANRYHLLDTAIPPATAPRRRRGGDRNVAPPPPATQADVSLSEKPLGTPERTPLVAATQPRRSATAPSRSMREGALLARSERASFVPPGDERCPGTIDLEAWLAEHPPPNSS